MFTCPGCFSVSQNTKTPSPPHSHYIHYVSCRDSGPLGPRLIQAFLVLAHAQEIYQCRMRAISQVYKDLPEDSQWHSVFIKILLELVRVQCSLANKVNGLFLLIFCIDHKLTKYFFSWLHDYSWRDHLMNDVISTSDCQTIVISLDQRRSLILMVQSVSGQQQLLTLRVCICQLQSPEICIIISWLNIRLQRKVYT